MAAGLSDLPRPDRRAQLPGRHQRDQSDDAVGQHRVRPARRRRRARSASATRPTRWASPRRSTARRPRCIGGLRIGVSPLQMADAYATIADGGTHVAPTAITKVVFSDGSSSTSATRHTRACSATGEAYAATQVLKTVIQSGTGTAANYGCPAAGKTGTTTDYTDAWFVGYTPKLSTAVWVGYPARQRPDVRRQRTRPRIRRHAGGADLARLHGASQRRLLRRLHRSRRPVPRHSVLRQVRDHGRQHHAPNLGAVRIELGLRGSSRQFEVSLATDAKLRRRRRRVDHDQAVQQPVALRAASTAAGNDWQSLRRLGTDINSRAGRAAKRTEAGSFVGGRVRHPVPRNPS